MEMESPLLGAVCLVQESAHNGAGVVCRGCSWVLPNRFGSQRCICLVICTTARRGFNQDQGPVGPGAAQTGLAIDGKLKQVNITKSWKERGNRGVMPLPRPELFTARWFETSYF